MGNKDIVLKAMKEFFVDRDIMVAWKEATGSTVTHIEDHENGILYSNATLPDGSFYTMKGTIRPLADH